MVLQFKEIVNLIEVIIWPLIILFILISFRIQLPEIHKRFGKRLKKISLGNLFELELSQLDEAKLNWTPLMNIDLRQPNKVEEFLSDPSSLLNQIHKES